MTSLRGHNAGYNIDYQLLTLAGVTSSDHITHDDVQCDEYVQLWRIDNAIE